MRNTDDGELVDDESLRGDVASTLASVRPSQRADANRAARGPPVPLLKRVHDVVDTPRP